MGEIIYSYFETNVAYTTAYTQVHRIICYAVFAP